jgi:hypothetical protein
MEMQASRPTTCRWLGMVTSIVVSLTGAKPRIAGGRSYKRKDIGELLEREAQILDRGRWTTPKEKEYTLV